MGRGRRESKEEGAGREVGAERKEAGGEERRAQGWPRCAVCKGQGVAGRVARLLLLVRGALPVHRLGPSLLQLIIRLGARLGAQSLGES